MGCECPNVTGVVNTSVRRQALTSTVGLKILMALSGLVMLGYLLVHAYGNLKFFQGQHMFDTYLDGLEDMFYPYLPHGGVLWLMRATLIGAVLAHATSALILWRRAHTAAGYVGMRRYHSNKGRAGIQRSYASFTMRWGGVTLALFILGHLAHMLPNWLAPGGASDSKYERVVNGFELWWVVLLYTIGLLALGLHLWHGFWSALTTLGQNFSASRKESTAAVAAAVLSVLLVGTFLALPYSIFFFGVGT